MNFYLLAVIECWLSWLPPKIKIVPRIQHRSTNYNFSCSHFSQSTPAIVRCKLYPKSAIITNIGGNTSFRKVGSPDLWTGTRLGVKSGVTSHIPKYFFKTVVSQFLFAIRETCLPVKPVAKR